MTKRSVTSADENGSFKEGKLLQIQNKRLKQTRHSHPHLVLGPVYFVAADSFWVLSTPDQNSRKSTTRIKQIVSDRDSASNETRFRAARL